MQDLLMILIFLVLVILSEGLWKSWGPNTRRITWGGLCLVMTTIYLYRISIGFEYPIMSPIFALIITIGGLLLLAIAFVPQLQASRLEYLSWALTQGLGVGLALGQAFFPKSQSVQFVIALIVMAINYNHQQANKEPYSHR